MMDDRDALLVCVAIAGIANQKHDEMLCAMNILVSALEMDNELWEAAVDRAREIFPAFTDIHTALRAR
jgi:hypothetical protein